MKFSVKFKKLISFFVILPCVFLPLFYQSNKVENNLISDSIVGETSSDFSTYKKSNKYSIGEISMGQSYSAATITDGNNDYLYTWGDNRRRQSGIQYLNPPDNYDNPQYVRLLPPEADIEQISMGYEHSAAILNDDEGDHLYVWGSNTNCQLGIPWYLPPGFYPNWVHHNLDMAIPVEVSQLPPGEIEQISMGNIHSAAVVHEADDDKDHLYTWGGNAAGQLGLGFDGHPDLNPDYQTEPNIDYYWTPQEVTTLPDGDIEQISMGNNNSFAVVNKDNKDYLYTWGNNDQGQLGLGNKIDYNTPQLVKNLPEGDIEQVSIGESHSGAIINDGNSDLLYTWGINDKGQLGLGNNINYDSPQKVTSLPEGEIKELSLGKSTYSHSAVIMNDGNSDSLYMWGSNEYGQLGLGNKSELEYNSPQLVTDLPRGEFLQISLGGSHSALSIRDSKGEDHLYVWGLNDYGQLGYGNNYKNQVEYNNGKPYYDSPHQIFPGIATTLFHDNWYYFLLVIIIIIFYILIIIWVIRTRKTSKTVRK